MDYLTKPTSRNDLRKYAILLRQLFGVSPGGAFPVLDTLEMLPDIFPGSNYVVLEDSHFPAKTMALCSQNDLGGFTILLFGDDFETEKHFRNIMEYFKLNADEYEYEDKYFEPKRSTEVTFRLYLCSSDYSILIVTVKER